MLILDPAMLVGLALLCAGAAKLVWAIRRQPGPEQRQLDSPVQKS